MKTFRLLLFGALLASLAVPALQSAGICQSTLSGQRIQPGTLPVSKIQATGTASSATFLAGDGSWKGIVASSDHKVGLSSSDTADYLDAKLGVTAPLTIADSGGVRIIGMGAAGAGVNGYLLGSDWNTFSAKEPGLGNPSTSGYVLSSTAAGMRSWVPSASGPAGPQGPAGPAGATGAAGPAGATGPQGLTGATGAAGPAGTNGTNGSNGTNGAAATITAGSASALAAGATPTVSNSGTSAAAVFNFGIPAGPQGTAGATGATGPQGATGATGATGLTGAAGPAGATGATGAAGTNGTNGTNGAAATVAVGSTTTLAAGSAATVTNSGTSSAAVFNFGIPMGATGASGTGGTGGGIVSVSSLPTASASTAGSLYRLLSGGSGTIALNTYGTEFDSNAGSGAGSTGQNQGASAFDGNSSTFFASNATSGAYIGLDFGSSPKTITQIAYICRAGFESRLNGAVFQGSNTSYSTGYVTLATISSTPANPASTSLAVTNTTAFRWVRLYNASGYGDVAELQFTGNGTLPDQIYVSVQSSSGAYSWVRIATG